MLSCSHECANISVVSSAGLIGNLSHQEVLGELGEKPGGFTGIGDTTNIESGLHVVESSTLLHSEVGVNALVNEASDVGNSLGDGLKVVLDVALVEQVGGNGSHVNVALELGNGVTIRGTRALTLGLETGDILGIRLQVADKLIVGGLESFEANHAVRGCVGGILLELQEELLLEGLIVGHVSFHEGQND